MPDEGEPKLIERIEALLVRERLFREDFEHRIKAELRDAMATQMRETFLRLPVILDTRAKTLIHTIDGQRLILDMRESFMALHLMEHGAWETPVRAVIARVLPRGGHFLDIGANIGAHALYAASLVGPEGLVTAVEPGPQVREILHENVEINGLLETIKICDAAASERAGETVAFEYFPRHPAMSAMRVAGERRAAFSDETEMIQVKTQTIDTLAAQAGRAPDLVKIDIEGFELVALRGAPQTLALRDTAWLIEYVPSIVREVLGASAPDALWSLIAGAGLNAHAVNETVDPEPMTTAQFANSSLGGDLLLLHPDGAPAQRMFAPD